MARNPKPESLPLPEADDEIVDGEDAETQAGTAPAPTPRYRSLFQEDDISKLEDILRAEDVTGGKVKIHRRGPTATRYAYVGEVRAEEFNLEWVKAVHGGGSYIFKLHDRSGRKHKEFEFDIDPRIVGTLDRPPVVPAASGEKSNDMLAIVMQMSQQQAAQQQANLQLLVTLMAEGQKSMAQMLGAVLGARGNAAQSEPVSALLTAATGLIGNRRQEPTPMEQMGSMLTLLRELRSMTGGPVAEEEEKETTGDKLLGMVAQGLPAVMQMIAARQNPMGGQPPAPAGPRVVNPQPQAIQGPAPVPATPIPTSAAVAPAPTPVSSPAPEGSAQAFFDALPDSGKLLIAQLRNVFPLLESGARTDKPVDSFLDILDAAIDDQADALLESIMVREDWKLILFGIPNPEPGQWFDNLREAYLGAPEETPAQPVPPAVNGGTLTVVP